MNQRERTKLSKFMSLILRHHPAQFGLALDDDGYVPIDELHSALTRQRDWHELTRADILEVVATSEKERFEVKGDKIRARYGHSVTTTPDYEEVEPPALLYHGTPRRAVSRILCEGLKPMARQYVHLSTTRKLARQVGDRRDAAPVILEITAHKAYMQGIVFYRAGDDIYLVDHVPAQFIRCP